MENIKAQPPVAAELPKEKDVDDMVHEMPPAEEVPIDTSVDGDDLVHAMPPPAPSPLQDPDDAVHETGAELDGTDERA